jgi:KDO II ethanolaminephosphotransferase
MISTLEVIMHDTSLAEESINVGLILFCIAFGIIPTIVISKLRITHNISFKKTLLFNVLLLVFIFGIHNHFYNKRHGVGDYSYNHRLTSFSQYTPLDFIRASSQTFSFFAFSHNLIPIHKEYEYNAESDDDLKVIFILGESTVSDRLSINGYIRNTTPNLKELSKSSNFINFNSIESCRSVTVASTICLFSRMTSSTYQYKPTESSIVDIFKVAGFKVNLISSQDMTKVFNYFMPDTKIYQPTIKLDRLINYNEKPQYSTVLDEYILPYVEESFKQEGKTFEIIQLIGTHYIYRNRYPAEFSKIKPDQENTPEAQNNAYDNAVLYTDFIISEIIKKAENKKAIIFYTSDHSQSLGDGGRWYHGGNKNDTPEQFRVPFFVYLTPKFANTKQGMDVLKTLKKNVGREDLSHDNLFHTVLGCTGFYNKDKKKPLIDNDLNLCSQE